MSARAFLGCVAILSLATAVCAGGDKTERWLEEARQRPEPAEKPAPKSDAATAPMSASSEGKIVEVSCTPRGSMKRGLELPAYKLEFRATDFQRVRYPTGGWEPPQPFDPCQHLKGLRVRVIYTVGGPRAGEILSIEIKKQ